MTRPKKLGRGLVVLAVHVTPELRLQVYDEARRRGMPVSVFVTEALGLGMLYFDALYDWRAPAPGKEPSGG